MLKDCLLTRKEIKHGLSALPNWRYSSIKKAIHTERKTKNFISAVRIIRKIAPLAERMDHHPDLHLTGYRHLAVVLSTHDAGGVTQKDLTLAKKVEKLFKTK